MTARDTTKRPIEDFAYFKDRLAKGNHGTRLVAAELRAAGLDVVLPENGFEGLRAELDIAAIEEYAKKNEDIYVQGRLWETKSHIDPRRWFTCPNDFRFPTIIVDTAASYEAKSVKPVGYIFVAWMLSNVSIMGLLTEPTRPFWSTARLRDGGWGFEDSFLMCPKEHLLDREALVTAMRRAG